MKGIKQPISPEETIHTKWQKGARKDVERTFGVLKSTWRFSQNPIKMWKIDDIASRVTACFILSNILVLDHVMEAINATYDPFFSLEEDEEMMIPQSNEFEHQHNKYANLKCLMVSIQTLS